MHVLDLKDSVVKALGFQSDNANIFGFELKDASVGRSIEFDLEIDNKTIVTFFSLIRQARGGTFVGPGLSPNVDIPTRSDPAICYSAPSSFLFFAQFAILNQNLSPQNRILKDFTNTGAYACSGKSPIPIMASQGSDADPHVEPKSSPSSTPAVVPASVVDTPVVKDGGVTTDPMDVMDSVNWYDNSPGSSSFPRPSVPGISDSSGPSFSYNTPQANNSLSGGHSFHQRMVTFLFQFSSNLNIRYDEIRAQITPGDSVNIPDAADHYNNGPSDTISWVDIFSTAFGNKSVWACSAWGDIFSTALDDMLDML
ncbi:hypothetical protein Tco_1403217 [Tanacetum coccineum]